MKLFVKIVLIGIGLIALFIFVLYATLKTKSTNLDKYSPYKEWIGKTVYLQREIVLFTDPYFDYKKSYPYLAVDSLHPRWEYFEEVKKNKDAEVVEIKTIPAGTALQLEQAVQYTNGVSGSSSPVIFGTINFQGITYKIGYYWGVYTFSTTRDINEYLYHFNTAPWQLQQDTNKYVLPTANTW